jgi:proteasome accessory factor B
MRYGTVTRIYDLDRWIRLKQLESVQWAADRLEVSPRTIERDLQHLREALHADIIYDRSSHRYDYVGEPVTLPGQWLNEKEIALLLIAERALREFVGTSFYREIHPAFNKLLDPIRRDEKTMEYARQLARAVDFHLLHRDSPNVSKLFSVLLDAIMHRQRVSFEYRSGERHLPRSNFDPCMLRTNGEHWFVTGFCHRRKEMVPYHLDLIHNLRLEDHYFYRDDDDT